MKISCAFLVLGLLSSSTSFAGGDDFPPAPAPDLTPGDLCEADEADARRYPERIPYCSRSVSVSLKEKIVDLYDNRYGYRVREIGRHNFKIDHYIPLCMGGSNDMDNLWPQHLSISRVTDPLEPLACEKMAEGRLQQSRAVEIIRAAKADPRQVPSLLRQLQAL